MITQAATPGNGTASLSARSAWALSAWMWLWPAPSCCMAFARRLGERSLWADQDDDVVGVRRAVRAGDRQCEGRQFLETGSGLELCRVLVCRERQREHLTDDETALAGRTAGGGAPCDESSPVLSLPPVPLVPPSGLPPPAPLPPAGMPPALVANPPLARRPPAPVMPPWPPPLVPPALPPVPIVPPVVTAPPAAAPPLIVAPPEAMDPPCPVLPVPLDEQAGRIKASGTPGRLVRTMRDREARGDDG